MEAPLIKFQEDTVTWISEFLKSKRNIVLVVTVLTIGYQMYQHVQRGEPIPETLIAALVAAFSSWQISDGIRPTMPKVAA
jgi:hypothetical protein